MYANYNDDKNNETFNLFSSNYDSDEEKLSLSLSISPVKQIRKPIRSKRQMIDQKKINEILKLPEAPRYIEGIVYDISVDYMGLITINIENSCEIEFDSSDIQKIALTYDEIDRYFVKNSTREKKQIYKFLNDLNKYEDEISDNADKYAVYTTPTSVYELF